MGRWRGTVRERACSPSGIHEELLGVQGQEGIGLDQGRKEARLRRTKTLRNVRIKEGTRPRDAQHRHRVDINPRGPSINLTFLPAFTPPLTRRASFDPPRTGTKETFSRHAPPASSLSPHTFFGRSVFGHLMFLNISSASRSPLALPTSGNLGGGLRFLAIKSTMSTDVSGLPSSPTAPFPFTPCSKYPSVLFIFVVTELLRLRNRPVVLRFPECESVAGRTAVLPASGTPPTSGP